VRLWTTVEPPAQGGEQAKGTAAWGKLTDDDLDLIEGRKVELVGKIQERYGLARDAAEKQVDSWMRNV
jgi:uncharacterized protein YjbJ (UPF0337 family)